METTHQTLRYFWSRNKVGQKPDQSKLCYQHLNECWDWTGPLAQDGYGKAKASGVHLAAHRLSWLVHNGSIPHDRIVLHRCDVRHCVNPDHLFLGTPQDNNSDKIAKGRSNPARGNELPHSKLDETKVKSIRDAARRGVPQKAIAATFGVCQQAVQRVVARISWKHVP